ncbi:DUF6416 domain-containing protein [Streptomyces chumphonensis]|uniref:DUF6416 domain-containing protein n=1 Tax=Streptomyces chumphonensis TaxID=1214925 RepID=UPI003D72EB59
MITVDLGSGGRLGLSPAQAWAVLEQLENGLEERRDVDAPPNRPFPLHRWLDDDDPTWDRHSGGGRDVGEWDVSKDLERAATLYASTPANVRYFLDFLADRPGRLLDADEIWERSEGRFTGRSSLSGALSGIAEPYRASHRNYPFYWWKGEPSQYAMKPSVAELFRTARRLA